MRRSTRPSEISSRCCKTSIPTVRVPLVRGICPPEPSRRTVLVRGFRNIVPRAIYILRGHDRGLHAGTQWHAEALHGRQSVQLRPVQLLPGARYALDFGSIPALRVQRTRDGLFPTMFMDDKQTLQIAPSGAFQTRTTSIARIRCSRHKNCPRGVSEPRRDRPP